MAGTKGNFTALLPSMDNTETLLGQYALATTVAAQGKGSDCCSPKKTRRGYTDCQGCDGQYEVFYV
jgi:hypothetical protein